MSICIYLYDSNDFGASALIPLFKLLVVVVFAMVFFVIVVLGIVAKNGWNKYFSIMKILKSELLLAFSTSSSEAVLPIMMKKMERFVRQKMLLHLLFLSVIHLI